MLGIERLYCGNMLSFFLVVHVDGVVSPCCSTDMVGAIIAGASHTCPYVDYNDNDEVALCFRLKRSGT